MGATEWVRVEVAKAGVTPLNRRPSPEPLMLWYARASKLLGSALAF